MSDRPDVNFVETDGDLVKAEMVKTYETETGRTMYPADPERLAVLGHAALVIQERGEPQQHGAPEPAPLRRRREPDRPGGAPGRVQDRGPGGLDHHGVSAGRSLGVERGDPL